jgi:hypothetical protein
MTDLRTGEVLAGRFELRSALGGGGSGEVWLAHDQELDADVALKILSPAFAGDSRHVQLLRDECRKARLLQHPNIVRVYDFHESDGRAFISMQYVSGGSLLQRRGAPLRDLLNVLVDPRGVAYLADFGIAAGIDIDGLALRGGGSLPAMSPQQLAGADPAIADDVYGFGALLFELLAGQPLFHPGATPERVRDEVPALPERDGTGEALPPVLLKLLAAMLHKEPERRPAGMAAIRSVLDDLAIDLAPAGGAGVIRPVRRQAAAPAPAAARAARERAGLPAGWVLGGLGVLLVVALGVVFLLPGVVQERAPPVARPAPPPPAAPVEEGVADENSAPEQQALADEVLGELLVLQDRLRERGVERWGGGDWSEVQRLAGDGDARYRERNYPEAATNYRRALTLLKVLQTRVDEVLAGALAEGDAALLAGDRRRALDSYELALAVDADNPLARRGLERAGRLQEVLTLMSEATARESAGDLRGAADAYGEALGIDPDWTPAREGRARTEGALVTAAYERQMARGYSALAQRDWSASRDAFNAALRSRPGDADARAALQQVAAEERLQRVVALEARARELEAAEDWPGAVRQYEAALQLDATLQSAQQALAKARRRAELGRRLEDAVADADDLNEDPAWQAARALADEARAAQPVGPKLAAQIAALERVLRVAATPVPVRFESDNLTDVVIYKVGRLGNFDTRTIELRPGSYVAVGSRDGYRDARRSFRVAADGSTPPIVVRCEEPI